MDNTVKEIFIQSTRCCPVCTEDGSLVYDATQNILISHYKDGTGVSNLLIVKQKTGGPESVIIKVNCCPWCGNNLQNKSTEEK